MRSPEVTTTLSNHPKKIGKKLLQMRELIHSVGQEIPEVQCVDESLKWGQPSFAHNPKKIGSSIRLDRKDDGVSLYFICTTTLVEDFKEVYPETFNYVGNREIHIKMDDEFDEDALKHCIAMTLTYKLKNT